MWFEDLTGYLRATVQYTKPYLIVPANPKESTGAFFTRSTYLDQPSIMARITHTTVTDALDLPQVRAYLAQQGIILGELFLGSVILWV